MAQAPRKKTTTGAPPRPPSGSAGATAEPVARDNPTEVPESPEAVQTRSAQPVRGERTSPPRGAGPTSRTSPVGGERTARTPRGSALERDVGSRTARSKTGQIGSLTIRGWPMSLKFSLAIVLLVSSAMLLFGWVASSTTETRLRNEIINSGYGQVLALRGFAQKVMAPFQGERNDDKLKTKLFDYTQAQAADKAFVQDFLDHQKRVYNVVILASAYPDANPTKPVLQGRETTGLARPGGSNSRVYKVTLPNADPEVLVYDGPYRVKEGGIEHIERVLYFRVPIREASGDKSPEAMYASLNLILSDKEITDELAALRRMLLLIGGVVAAAAVGIGLLLSRLTTRPVKELIVDMNEVAHGNFEHQSMVADSSRDEIGLLASAFNAMTLSLQAGRDSERENQRISGELNTAKAIHVKLMPEKLPQLPGIDIFTAYQSAKEVGGDYYDFIPVGDAAHLALCVADVSGKGIPGSMVMGTTRTILRMMAVNNLSAADVLDRTNFHVARDIKRGMFVTCVYCILNVRTHEMTIASAGHNPLLWYHASTGQVEKVRPNGIALGFDKGPIFKRTIREERIQLEKGDRVVLYTDGVVEAMNEAREEFSDEALDAFTLQNATLPSREFVRLLLKALDDHKGSAEQHDDITITTFRVV